MIALKNASSPLLLFVCMVLRLSPTTHASEKEYGVYEYVVRKAQGTFEQIASDLHDAATRSGWRVATTVDAGKMTECPYKSRVFLLLHPAYAKTIMEVNAATGPFAVLDRVNLFEDEDGIHVSVVNPHSINRTVLLDDEKYETMSEEHLQALRTMITSAIKGEESKKQYGEMRNRGYIGKTMGVVAGGPFDEKVEDFFTVPGGNVEEVAAKVEHALQQKGKEWGTHAVLNLPMPEYQMVIIGVSGTPLDTKSFEIVGAGSDETRENFKCPGPLPERA